MAGVYVHVVVNRQHAQGPSLCPTYKRCGLGVVTANVRGSEGRLCGLMNTLDRHHPVGKWACRGVI